MTFFFENVKLPFDEGIVVGVHICCYEGSRVINMQTIFLEMGSSQRREVFNPEFRIPEIGNLFFTYSHLLQNMVLAFHILREFWGISIRLQFHIKFLRCCRNRHPSAVVAEGEEHIITAQAFVPSIKITLCHGEGMTQVQHAIHVCVWESHKVFGLGRRLNREVLVTIPDSSGSGLQTDEFVSADKAFGFNFWLHKITK